MRINVYSEGVQLTPQLRGVVVSRMLSALGPFGAYIELVVVRLQANTGHAQPDTTACDVAVSLHPSGDFARGPETRRWLSRLIARLMTFAMESNTKYLGC